MASRSQLNDQANGSRLSRLLVDKGTQALRAVLDFQHRPSTLAVVLNASKPTLQALRYKVISASQWKLLYPTSGLPHSQSFDVTLLSVLLRNICGLTAPATGWSDMPPDSDTSVAANIVRIKIYRNTVYAHIRNTEIADNEFENLWQKICKALIGLGIPNSDLNELKEAPLSSEETSYIQQLENWCERDVELTKISRETNYVVKEIHRHLEQKSRESENVSQANKLGKCDFSGTIRTLKETFLPGTRQWLFDELSNWFSDEEDSDSNVMILTAGPGFGKSVFAAEVCRRYGEQGQLAAFHFCKYNNSDYSNPRMIIESLASNMCDNVTGFRGKLDSQLHRNHSKETLSDAFRVLLNDPLHGLEERGTMLLVIDALDESQVGGKSEFLQLIAEEFPKLPKWIKIFITSRPELLAQEELQYLKPVHITPRDESNEEDLLKYIRIFLSPICDDDMVLKSLAWECQGSFLYAYHIRMDLKRTTKQLTKENVSEFVPNGISGFYKKQFERLKNHLDKFCPSEIKLKRFLEVLVAAKGPLPLSLVPECLGLTDDTEYEVRNAINEVMSLILPVYDECLTVYHKSLIDWLTSDGYKEHAFTVDSQSGHNPLWKACEKVFNQIISLDSLDMLSSFNLTPLNRYALAYGISHMIQSPDKTSYHWSVDVKIVHARTTLNWFRLSEMKHEWMEILKNSFSSLSSELLQELYWHVRLFQPVLRLHENSAFYLQSVANRMSCSDGCSKKRSLARSLLEQGQYYWLEDLDATELTSRFRMSVSLRTDVTCLDVSSNEQLVAVGYKDGWISIFRLPNFQEVQIFDTMPKPKARRSSIFSPNNYMLLYDRFNRYLRTDKRRNLPFFGGDYGALWSCSFSPSGNRLVTCDGSEEIKLWDVNSGNLLARLLAGGPVDCCSFSECGLFIVAKKERDEGHINQTDVFTVWNAFTQQRVDRRNISDRFRFLPNGKNKIQLLLSSNGRNIDMFQLPEMVFVATLVRHHFPFLLPITRYHWRDCILYHTNESIKLSEFGQLKTMVTQQKGCLKLGEGVAIHFIGCPCSYLKSTRAVPVKVEGLYVVPSFDKLNVFIVDDKPSIVSFVSEPYVIACCCFSPDGSFLVTCANGDPLSVFVWDTKLCTIVQAVRFLRIYAGGCWWSKSLLWIYDGGLVKIPISNGRTLNKSDAQRVRIDWKPTKFLTFSDVLIFIDEENCANVARIIGGQLQYMEKLLVGNEIICAAVSPCNSVIFMAGSKSFHVWKENQSTRPLHWVALTTGYLPDFSLPEESDNEDSPRLVIKDVSYKSCITSDGSTGVLAVSFSEMKTQYGFISRCYIILVDLKSGSIEKIRSSVRIARMDILFAGKSYCVGVNELGGSLVAQKLTNGEVVAEWQKSREMDFFMPIIAHSKNDLVAIISKQRASIEFLKIVVPEWQWLLACRVTLYSC